VSAVVVIVLILAGACVLGIAASVVMSWASNRSALWNMVFSGVLVFTVFAALALVVIVLTRAAFPR
jgi:hypothetical protein